MEKNAKAMGWLPGFLSQVFAGCVNVSVCVCTMLCDVSWLFMYVAIGRVIASNVERMREASMYLSLLI